MDNVYIWATDIGVVRQQTDLSCFKTYQETGLGWTSG